MKFSVSTEIKILFGKINLTLELCAVSFALSNNLKHMQSCQKLLENDALQIATLQ